MGFLPGRRSFSYFAWDGKESAKENIIQYLSEFTFSIVFLKRGKWLHFGKLKTTDRVSVNTFKMALLDNAVITWHQMEKHILQIFKIVFLFYYHLHSLTDTKKNWVSPPDFSTHTIVMKNNN